MKTLVGLFVAVVLFLSQALPVQAGCYSNVSFSGYSTSYAAVGPAYTFVQYPPLQLQYVALPVALPQVVAPVVSAPKAEDPIVAAPAVAYTAAPVVTAFAAPTYSYSKVVAAPVFRVANHDRVLLVDNHARAQVFRAANRDTVVVENRGRNRVFVAAGGNDKVVVENRAGLFGNRTTVVERGNTTVVQNRVGLFGRTRTVVTQSGGGGVVAIRR